MEDSLEHESGMYITQSSSSMAAPVIEGNEILFFMSEEQLAFGLVRFIFKVRRGGGQE